MATPSIAVPFASTCRNCGHDRKDHSFDDGCWEEITNDGRATLCTCRRFEPIVQPIKPAVEITAEWQTLFREAVVETQSERLLLKITKAELAIRKRMIEVRPSDGREWQGLRDALQMLKFLKAPL